jgi:Na+:H+ antiporter, NhaA family
MHQDTPAAPGPAGDSLPSRILKPIERFFKVEAASGIVLLVATAVALAWANSRWAGAYEALWHLPIRLGAGSQDWHTTLHFWVNDGLMTVFFLVAGLEIRRELHDGALADARRAAVPVAGALGGIIVPAAIYLTLATGDELQRGWAIPTATDIAFAVGVLAVLGNRVPSSVRVLLLALAIVDDIAAILVIAFIYSSGVNFIGLLIAAAGVAAVLAFQQLSVRSALPYVLPGVVIWAGLLYAGVHPTLAGVILGLLTPTAAPQARERIVSAATHALIELRSKFRAARRDTHELAKPVQSLRRAQRDLLPPVVRIEYFLHPWVAYAIMPLFALANAGVKIESISFGGNSAGLLTTGILAALVIGKPLGIVAFTWLVTRTGLGTLAEGLDNRGILLVGCLGGIGFTMSIFIANLAFEDATLLAAAKLAVLLGSTIAGVGGLLFGWASFKSITRPSRRVAG